MKQYYEARQAQLFEEFGVFFAFGKKQFEEQRKEGVEYCTVFGAGDCVPKLQAEEFVRRLALAHKEAREQALSEMGIEAIIRYQLNNHEATYTRCIDDALEALKGYSVTRDQVMSVYRLMLKEED